MEKIFFKSISVLCAISILSGCSVFMAAKGNGGTDLEHATKCKTRACLIGSGAQPIEGAHKNESGKLTSEIFKVTEPTGSAARAAMHGVLDLATWGVWELAGTPIEASLGKAESFALVVTECVRGNETNVSKR
jgi:hypothetical protein